MAGTDANIKITQKELSTLQIWQLAIRPKTLPAAAASAITGSAAAFWSFKFQPGLALACLLIGLLLQIGSNLANDVFDYYRGTDTQGRLGPIRVTQSGLLRPEQVIAGMWVVFGMAAILGIYTALSAGWQVILVGIIIIASAIAYSGGPFPYGYYGLGDLMVFIFFGVVAVCLTYYVQAKSVDPIAIWSSLPMGFLITGILVINNLRDLFTDGNSGKKTLAVLLGKNGTRWEFSLCLAAAYLTPAVMTLTQAGPAWLMLSWLSAPRAIRINRMVWTTEGRPLNLVLADAGQLALMFSLLYSIGLVLDVLV